MTLHLRPIPARPVRIDIKPNPEDVKKVRADLRRSIRKAKRRKPCPITYSHS